MTLLLVIIIIDIIFFSQTQNTSYVILKRKTFFFLEDFVDSLSRGFLFFSFIFLRNFFFFFCIQLSILRGIFLFVWRKFEFELMFSFFFFFFFLNLFSFYKPFNFACVQWILSRSIASVVLFLSIVFLVDYCCCCFL